MENNNQKPSDNLNNFQTELVLKKGLYVDILINDKWYQGYIKEEKPNNKYDILFLLLPNKSLEKKSVARKSLSFFGDNYFINNNNIREIFLDQNFNELNVNNVIDILVDKLTEINIDYNDIKNFVSNVEEKKNFDLKLFENNENIGKDNSSFIIKDNNNYEYNITGFYTYQLFSGIFIDSIVFVNDTLEKIRVSSMQERNNLVLDQEFKKLLNIILDMVIFALIVGKNNLSNIKNYIQFNRKKMLVNKISSILVSIEAIISNILIIFCYEYYDHPHIETKLKMICSLCYEIILDSTRDNKCILPIQFLATLINFILYEDNIIRIDNFDKNKIYKALLITIQNISGEDIKYIKNFNQINIYCKTIITKLYKRGNVLINNCYYSFLINCLTKSNILEKRIMALNCINDIIIDFIDTEEELNMIFYDFFINKNNIMDIFFEETVHEEILKRSIELFKYLSFYDVLKDELINKLIKLNNNTTTRNILCEIIKFLSNDKKNQLFKKITKDYHFDDNNNENNMIEFVSKLTLACFASMENRNNKDLENDLTSGNISNEGSIYNKNVINDNINDSKRISINIQMLKMGFYKNKNNKKINRNLSNHSLEKLLLNSTSDKKINRKKSLKRNKIKIHKKNYYGLELLFNYIIYNYIEIKALINNNNISKAIKSFKYILDSTRTIKVKDIYYFLDKLLENISSNKKHNSVVQSLILIDILLNKLLQFNNRRNNIYQIIQNNAIINYNDLNLNEEEGEIISELDNKYDIITLITNDLIRYVCKVHENKDNINNENYKNEIFEGIYPYMKNISIRLKLLFFFVNFGILINEEDIGKIYSLFKDDQFKNERLLFFREISNNIDCINIITLRNIFCKIFQNNTQFDITSFDDEDTYNLINDLFININLLKDSLIDDTKTIRANQDLNKLEGIYFLFNILISNKNNLIQNKLCQNLSHICIYLSDYKKEFSTKYWNNFINEITNLMENCNKNKNVHGILGLIQLIETIYSYNYSWKIPTKEETHIAEDPSILFHFCCPQRNNKIYKLKVGKKDKILHMRWKLAYYYDIYVNNLVICDLNNKEYNFTYDNVNFYEIFPPKKYILNDLNINPINVYDYPDQLFKIPNNPKELIQKNEKIIYILIENLNYNNNNDNTKNDDFLMKKKIWNIMHKLPKNQYIEKTIKQFGKKSKIEKEELKFNINEIFILTFNLQCILNYIYGVEEQEKNKEKKNIKEINNFLEIFINFHHIDRILYKNLININIDFINDDNNKKFIYFECIKSLLELIQIIEGYKMKKTINFFYYLNNNKDNDKETIQTKQENENEKNNEDDLEATKINNSIILKESIFEIIGNKQLYTKLSDIIIAILNDNNSSNDLLCFNLLKELINFIELINNNFSNNNNNTYYQNYFNFIFENEELFKKIYIFDFIKSSKEEVKKLLSDFLLKNLFDNYLIVKNNNINSKNNKKEINDNDIDNKSVNSKEYIKNYFNILLTPDMFDYLVNNQKNGTYFYLLSSIIDKYITYNKKSNQNEDIISIDNSQENNKYKDNFQKIIDLIIKNIIDKNNSNNTDDKNSNEQDLLTYPYNNQSSSESNSTNKNLKKSNNKKAQKIYTMNGILLFLLRILELSSDTNGDIIEYFLKKVDICDLFLLKGVLNKCNINNLDAKKYIFGNINSHKIIFQIIIFILQFLDKKENIIKDNKYLEDSLYMKIWKTLNKYHKLGFWKKNKNFQLNYNDVNRKEFIGLKNMSSTCYMNSILQQFFMIPMLRETILSIGKEDKIDLNPNTILYQLQLLFASLKAYDFKYYDPKDFVIVSKLSFYEQMDADEYYGLLIDKLENDISNLYIKDKNKNNYKDLFKYFFGIKLTDELFFTECNHKRFNESFCYNIQLEVKNYTNISDSLRNYFKTEIMTGDNKINCEECNTKRVCHKQLKIKNMPNILVISLKRFDYDYKKMIKFKLNSYFEFPFELNLSEFLLNQNNENAEKSNEDNLYELTGLTIHYGVSDFGHYYDLIKAANNKWYMFNDIVIKEVSESDIPKEAFGVRENDNDINEETSEKSGIKHQDKKNAYILIYTKKNFNNNFVKNKEYNTKLIMPPYDKLSNLNKNMKSYINYKMFKYWTLENLSNPFYQNFIIELLKIDLLKNIHLEINKEHTNIKEELKNEEKFSIKNYINTGNTIFSFGLLYFCNIMLRVKEKKNIDIYTEILTVYLENDINKCLYLLEEFGDIEILNDFFLECSNVEVVKIISELIYISFTNYLSNCDNENESEINNSNLFKFLNCIILFISNKANGITLNSYSLDNIVKLFCKLISKEKIFLKYLKYKGIDKWLDEIINKINNIKNEMGTFDNLDEDEAINMNILLTETDFPKLECNHSILREETKEFNFDFLKNKRDIKKMLINAKKAKNENINSCDSIVLLKRLQEDIKEIKL